MIPRILIQTWKDRRLPEQFKTWVNTWKMHCPNFKYLFFDDRDCFRLVYKYYPEYLDLYESLSPIGRSDMFRYLALHHYGGVYADIDTICLKNIVPLLDLFPTSVITGFEYNNPPQYLQWFIACPKGIGTMIELVEEIGRRTNTWVNFIIPSSLNPNPNVKVYYTTGPVMFTEVLKCTKFPVAVLEKGKLGCYDRRLINDASYLQHLFIGSWKAKRDQQNSSNS